MKVNARHVRVDDCVVLDDSVVAPRKSNKKFSISFTILTFLLQFAFCPCFMYIFYWYALTPNSIGGLPASYAPISGAAPVIDTVKG